MCYLQYNLCHRAEPQMLTADRKHSPLGFFNFVIYLTKVCPPLAATQLRDIRCCEKNGFLESLQFKIRPLFEILLKWKTLKEKKRWELEEKRVCLHGYCTHCTFSLPCIFLHTLGKPFLSAPHPSTSTLLLFILSPAFYVLISYHTPFTVLPVLSYTLFN